MKIQSINDLRKLKDFNDWQSQEIEIEAMGHMGCTFLLEDFDPEIDFNQFQEAINNFIAMGVEEFRVCENYLFQYYQDIMRLWEPEEERYVRFNKPSEVWKHVDLSNEITVTKRAKDQRVYLSISGYCDWEEEHGLQIVFCQGKTLVKVGSFTGHLTNSDENVIYQQIST